MVSQLTRNESALSIQLDGDQKMIMSEDPAIQSKRGTSGKPLYSILGYSMSSLYINDQKSSTLRCLKRCQSCTWTVYIMLIIAIAVLSVLLSE